MQVIYKIGGVVACLISLPILRLVYSTLRYFWNKQNYNHILKVHPRTKLPMLFRAIGKDGQVEEVMEEMFDKQNGQYYDIVHQGFLYGGDNSVGISHPDDIKTVLSNEALFARDFSYEFISEFLGKGLVTASGEVWRIHRKKLTPAFHLKSFKKLVPLMANHTTGFIEGLKKEIEQGNRGYIEFNCVKRLKKLTLNVITTCLVSDQMDMDMTGQLFEKALESMYIYFFARVFFGSAVKNIPIEFIQRVPNTQKKLSLIFKELIDKRRKIINHENMKGKKEETEEIDDGAKDIMDMMIDCGFTDQEIADEALTLLFAGHDTTSSSLGWGFYFLCQHPEYEEKILNDIHTHNFDIEKATPEMLDRLTFIKQFFQECLRLRPVVNFLDRKVTEDCVLANHFIPKGTVVNVHIANVHRDPRYWKDPLSFNPERFSYKYQDSTSSHTNGSVDQPSSLASEDQKKKEKSEFEEEGHKRHPFAYIPFSAASRNCIGQKFAMYQLTLVFASVLKEFRVEPVHPNQQYLMDLTSTINCPNGFMLRLVPRT